MPTHSAWGTDPTLPITFDDYADPEEPDPCGLDALTFLIANHAADSATASGLDDDWLGDDDYDEAGALIVRPTTGTGTPMRFQRGRNPRLARAWDRRRRVVELKIQGYTYAQIAEECGFNSVDGARDAFNRAMQDTRDVAEEWRDLQLARYEEITNILWPMIKLGDLEAMDKYLKVSAQTMKLTKMDAAGLIGHGPGERGETIVDQFERIAMVEDVNAFLAALPGIVALSPQPGAKIIDAAGNEIPQPEPTVYRVTELPELAEGMATP